MEIQIGKEYRVDSQFVNVSNPSMSAGGTERTKIWPTSLNPALLQ
jgi:hypothetical protein